MARPCVPHNAEHLAVAYNCKGENGETEYDASEALHRTYELATQIDIEGWLLGFNWDRIGGRCSIIVVSAMGTYLLYAFGMFVSRALIIYAGSDLNVTVSAVKAAFSQIYLLTEQLKRRRSESQKTDCMTQGDGINDAETGRAKGAESAGKGLQSTDQVRKETMQRQQPDTKDG